MMMWMRLLHAAVTLFFLSGPALAQERPHQRRIPHRLDRPSIREQVIKKYERQEEMLTNMILQRQAAVDDHLSGRKLLDEKELSRHQLHVKGLQRKLAGAKQKDPKMRALEIEHEIELQEKMMAGEFIWTPGSDELVLKDP